MIVPIAIGDYTDFFSSMHHAKNCGTIFRGPENPIPQNWYVEMRFMAIKGPSESCKLHFAIPLVQSLTMDILPFSGFTFLLHIMEEHHQ